MKKEKILSISELLKTSRKALNLTQGQMAEKLKTPFRTYQCWEYGNRSPKPLTQEGIRERVKNIMEENKC